MTLLPEVRRQLHDAAARQAGSRSRRLRSRGARMLASRTSVLAPVLGVCVVIAVAAVFIGVRGTSRVGGTQTGETVQVVFVPRPADVTAAAVSRTAAILRERLDAAFGDVQVSTSGQRVVVVVRHAPAGARERVIALSTPGRLEFYDWEANALTPNGKTVASQMQTGNPQAVKISQGSGSAAPGAPGAGSMPLYDAVRLASRQPGRSSPDNARLGRQYYVFGAPGSPACARIARLQGRLPVPGLHCLLAGPADTRADATSILRAHGLTAGDGRELAVPPGTTVLRAADTSASQPPAPDDPRAQFYVLEDHVAVFGNAITNPRQSTDQAGNPDITFAFTSKGAAEFQRVTAQIARRGDLVSGLGNMFNQHFAIALDDKLITVPQIDFKSYPDGITGAQGADIAGAFTIQSARDLARQLRLGALPLSLTVQ